MSRSSGELADESFDLDESCASILQVSLAPCISNYEMRGQIATGIPYHILWHVDQRWATTVHVRRPNARVVYCNVVFGKNQVEFLGSGNSLLH